MYDSRDPSHIGRRLIQFAARVGVEEILFPDLPKSYHEQDVLLHEFGVANRCFSPAEEMIVSLEKALENFGWDPDVSGIPLAERDRWTFGTAITFRTLPKPILRGFVQPLRREPLLRGIPDRVALYIITLDGGNDYLERETHGMGWHYHYLNRHQERSNVILSWDTRWKEPCPQTKPPTLRALFVEPHGEKSNSCFVARTSLWGYKKRASIHDACLPDLTK